MNQPRRPEALMRHPLADAAAVIATATADVFDVLLNAALAALFTNQYAGLVVFVAVPIVATTGAALIPLGMWLQRRRLRQHPDAPSDWPVWDFRDPRVRRLALLLVALAAVNGTVMLLAGYSSLHWMDSPGFCGLTCHTPMHPQYTAWQTGPHARIACASCHIGAGATGFVHAKLNGMHQLVSVTTDTFARPIPAGAVQPAGGFGGTCGSCHQAGRIPGDIVRVLRSYGDDEKNTETLTVLLMHVGRGSPGSHAIHWHADPGVNVEYMSTGAGRQTIPYVRVTNANGQVKGVLRGGRRQTARQSGTAAPHGLRGLPQHGGSPDLADGGTGRRRSARGVAGEPPASVRAPRERARAESGVYGRR